MCLALPARVITRLGDDEAIVELGGVRKQISLALVPEARVDDYVIVHVGHAIGLIDPVEAERTLALFAELEGEAARSAETDHRAATDHEDLGAPMSDPCPGPIPGPMPCPAPNPDLAPFKTEPRS